jgi:hypothetical protein
MIAAATESNSGRDPTGRHRPIVYALLTNNQNLNEPGDDVIVRYDDETDEWVELGNPAEAYNG